MSTTSSRPGSRRPGRIGALAALVLLGGACDGEAPEPAPKTPAPYSRPAYANRVSEGPAEPLSRFEDAAEAAGLRFVHENGARGRKYLLETMGSGAAVLDYDGDGRMDVFLVNGRPWPGEDAAAGTLPTAKLFRNRGDGTFEDVTRAAGLDAVRFGMGVAVADYDGDGDPDIFVTAVGACALYRNDGGRFTDVAKEAGVAGEPWIDEKGRPRDPCWSCAAFLDYDRDGIPDLYVCRYVRWSRDNDVFTSIDGKTKAYTIPDRYRGDSGRLYRGRGDGTFEDVTKAAGLLREDAKALGVAACDLDGDGWTDIFVANDGEPNLLFRNRGDGTFEECGLPSGIAYDSQGKARAGMGAAVAYVDEGGFPVIATGTFSQEALAFYRRRAGARGFTFVDEGPAAGVAGPTFPSLTFGLVFQDFDLDGRPDLAIANGHIEPTIQQVMHDIPYAQPAQVFRNLGGGRFEDVTARSGPAFQVPSVGRGLAWIDYDGDGDPDLLLTQNGGPVRLLRNDAPPGRKSLRLRLDGTGRNRDALGAVVTVAVGGVVSRAERQSGGSYLSESEPTLLFGLGDRPGAEKVHVRWPGKDAPGEDLGPLAAGLWKVKQGAKPVRIGE
jgi:hypothetical protein